MRLWSIHPKYLNSNRLTAQWREALLCRAVLEGKTIGYKNHPQFLRVKEHTQPHYFINYFLYVIWEESKNRGFNFDKSKLHNNLVSIYGGPLDLMNVTTGQLDYEFEHLQKKLGEFNEQYSKNQQYFDNDGIEANPCFIVSIGEIMEFEKTKK